MGVRPVQVDLSLLLDHPGAYVSYNPASEVLYLNLMPQVDARRQVTDAGTGVSVDVDRDGRTIGLSICWNPTIGDVKK